MRKKELAKLRQIMLDLTDIHGLLTARPAAWGAALEHVVHAEEIMDDLLEADRIPSLPDIEPRKE